MAEDHDALVKVVADLAAFDRLTSERWQSTRVEMTTATAEIDKRFEKVYEFRQMLNDAQATMITQNEADAAHKALSERIDQVGRTLVNTLRVDVYETQHQNLTNRVETLESWRTSITARASIALGIVGLAGATVGAIVGHLLR